MPPPNLHPQLWEVRAQVKVAGTGRSPKSAQGHWSTLPLFYVATSPRVPEEKVREMGRKIIDNTHYLDTLVTVRKVQFRVIDAPDEDLIR